MSGIAVEVQDLGFSYPDGTKALEAVSFRVEAGECLGILGANGAGKSTLLMALSGLVIPERGSIAVGGEVLEKDSLARLRRKLGYVFQDPDDQLFMTSVWADVCFGPRNQGLDADQVRERSARALEIVGIPHLGDRPPFRLSGGQKRAAALASILSMEPLALALDEPTAALDPRARRRVLEILKGLPQTRIVASHDLDLVYDICDRVILLSQGRMLRQGRTADIVGDEGTMAEAGLELPLALQACPRCGSPKQGKPKEQP